MQIPAENRALSVSLNDIRERKGKTPEFILEFQKKSVLCEKLPQL